MATGGGLMPSTLSDRVCCTAAVESVRVRVAKRLTGWVGEAVTLREQVPFGARVVQFDTAAKSEGLGPLRTGALKVTGTVPVFTMATTVAGDVLPTIARPKSMEAGVAEKCIPVVRPTPMTPPYGTPLMFRVAVRRPSAEGVK